MQLKPWTDSTVSQVDYSGLTSLSDYTRPWNLSVSSDDPAHALFQWHETTDAGRFVHQVLFQPHLETAGQWYMTVLPRMACHVIVNRMPDEGLPELCQSLGQMLEFYASRQPIERLARESPTKAIVVAHEERPPFYLVEEE